MTNYWQRYKTFFQIYRRIGKSHWYKYKNYRNMYSRYQLVKRSQTGILIALSVSLGFLFSFCWSGTQDDVIWNPNFNAQFNGSQLQYVMTFLVVALIDFLIGEFLRRLCIFIEELRHLATRYEGNGGAVFHSAMSSGSPRPFLTPIIVCILTTYLAMKPNGIDILLQIFGTTWNSVLIIGFIFIPYVMNLREPTVAELSDQLEKYQLNVGYGLAWSYYFGYLKLILPGLNKRLQTWQKENDFKNCKVVDKLLILVPTSCFCYPSLQKADNEITFAGHLESFKANRAGANEREYKNTIYQFTVEKETYYAIVEYATPILSLYEMNVCQEAGLSRKEMIYQMQLFMATLQDIIKSNPQTRENCYLIVYDDKLPDGNEVKVSELLKAEIDEQLRLKNTV